MLCVITRKLDFCRLLKEHLTIIGNILLRMLRETEFLIRLRETGMSIQEMLAFTKLVRQHPNEVGERRLLLEQHRDRVKQHLEDLTKNLKIIDMKIEHYQYLEATGENDRSCIFWEQYLESRE